jgi:hypothetical protein
MAYTFFLSYASADAENGGGAVEWFFETLCQRLNIVHGAGRVGQGGFAAYKIPGGADWFGEVLPTALNSSHVLVCLQSPNYFDSEYCGRELEVFLRRRQEFVATRGGSPPVCIIPVVWQPDLRPMPRVVPDFQWNRPDGSRFPAEVTGLFEAFDGHRGEGNKFIHQLAKRISALLPPDVSQLVLPSLDEPDIGGVTSAFKLPELPLPEIESVKASGPRAVTFVYPCDVDEDEWPFAPPPENAAVIHAASLARSRELSIQGIEFTPTSENIVDRVRIAQGRNTPVVLMLTPSTLANVGLVAQLSAIEPDGVATVIVDRQGSRPPAHVLPRLRQPGRFHAGLNNSSKLEQAIYQSLSALRQTVRQNVATTIAGAGPATLPQL